MSDEARPQLHASGMELLTNCGEAWRRRYLEGEIERPSGATIIGRATHTAIDLDLSNKIEKGALLDDDTVKEIAAETVQVGFDAEDVLLEEGETKAAAAGKSKDTAVGLAALHHGDVAPGLRPEAVEKKFLIHANGFPFDLAGRWDLLEFGDVVRDAKTAKAAMSQAKADGAIAFDAYAFAFKVTRGRLPLRMVFDCLVKTKTPKYVGIETGRTDEDVQTFLRRYAAACRVIEAEVFLPAAPDHWLCGPRYCGFWATCPYAKGKEMPKT